VTTKQFINDGVIAKLDVAKRALLQAKTIQETKKIMNIAGAAEVYAKRQKLGEEAIGYAHEIKVYALRKLGEMLKNTERAKPAILQGTKKVPRGEAPTLSSLGIDKKVSSLAQQIAALPSGKVEAVAKRVQSITQVLREKKADEIRKRVSLPDAKYRVIYADPPWSYGNTQPDYHTEQRDHYPTMKLNEICALKIKDICEPTAVLFLWVTSPILEESFEVVKSWGFKYKASFVWDKIKHNMGHYNSVRHEFLLVCTRGSCMPDIPKLFDSVISVPRSKHSEKPEIFYEIIETLYPHGKRIELFARAERKGWDRYGYESE